MDVNIIGHTKAIVATVYNKDLPEEQREAIKLELEKLRDSFPVNVDIKIYDAPVYQKEGRYIVFYWRYGGFEGSECDTMEEAKGRAEYISDEGEGSIACIYDSLTSQVVDWLYTDSPEEKKKLLTRINDYLTRQ